MSKYHSLTFKFCRNNLRKPDFRGICFGVFKMRGNEALALCFLDSPNITGVGSRGWRTDSVK